jgi:phosphoribosylamine-glycine ligase
VSGRRLLVPTEKALSAGDRTLLAARLDQAGSSPEVCAAARRQHVDYAIVGGEPFAWAGAKRVAKYRGIDRVGSSAAFTEVAHSAPYTLYRLTSCAGA